ncbi:MAG: glycosyltransferase [Candidatus Paceibacterota bacterium]
MNTLFVGPYRQNDGWGLATRSYIKAVATQHKNLTTRPVYLANPDLTFNDQEILGYEKNKYDKYDVVIQKTLPHCLFLNKSYAKNIGLFVLETNNIKESSCIENINRMDEIWVPSKIEEQCLKKSGVNTPVKIISQPLDTDFIEENRNYKLELNPILDNMFKFYFIGENNFRKNIIDLVTAFNLAFDYSEPVCLIIKTSQGGVNPQEVAKRIDGEISNLKNKLGITKKYKKEIILTNSLSYKDIIGLHNTCDCFVAPSYGEAFCRPVAEALVLGKTPMVNQNTGMRDYINDNNGFLVKSHKTPVILNNRTLSDDFDIYNANEYWYKINIYDLIEKMRMVYDLHKKQDSSLVQKQQNGIASLNNFSYESIGSKLCI